MERAGGPRNILFVTWDGPQTRYLERLFLPIFAGLAAHGYRFYVLQFTWAGTAAEDAVLAERSALCAAAGVPLRVQRIWRRPGGIGPFLSAALGAGAVRRAVAEWGIDTVMPRSLMPALAVLLAGRHLNRRIVFDADGLPADERVDFAGLSPHGPTYRLLRAIEARMLRRADAVLTRTEAARDILLARAGGALEPARCHVVSNGVDVVPFVAAMAQHKARGDGFVLCYCGSIGPQYRLTDMLEIALRLKAVMPDLRLRLLSQAQAEISRVLSARGLAAADWIEQRAIAAQDVPAALVQCDLGLALRAPSFSMRAVQPIKLGEYLLAGLPVIGTPGIGATAELEAEGVFRSGEPVDLPATLAWVQDVVRPWREEMRAAAHAAGLRHFSLEATVDRYRAALQAVGEAGSGQGPKGQAG